MQRSKRVLLVSHCILNQNTVINDEARAEGAVISAVEWAMKQGYGFLQLPCPEFTFLGLNRPSMTYEQYNTPEYRKHCREILRPVLHKLKTISKTAMKLLGCLAFKTAHHVIRHVGFLLKN